MPAAREAVSRRPECPGRSSSGSTISGPQAGRPGSASSHPEEARHSEARTILAPGSAQNLLQSPEGGRNRYFKIDFPPFRRRLPKEGASTWQRCLFKLSGVRYGDSHFSSCFLLYVDAFPCPILFLPLLRDCHRIFSAL